MKISSHSTLGPTSQLLLSLAKSFKEPELNDLVSNFSASEVYITSSSATKLKTHTGWHAGLTIQGVTIGTEGYRRLHLRHKGNEIAKDSDTIAEFLAEKPAHWLKVLAHSLLSRAQHLCANCNPVDMHASKANAIIDEAFERAISRILHINTSCNGQANRLKMRKALIARFRSPRRLGGLRIRGMDNLSKVAYAGAQLSFLRLAFPENDIHENGIDLDDIRKRTTLSMHSISYICPTTLTPVRKGQQPPNRLQKYTSSPIGLQFRSVWESLRLISQSGILDFPVSQAGFVTNDDNELSVFTGKYQKAISLKIDEGLYSELSKNMNQLPMSAEVRRAFEASRSCKISRSGLGTTVTRIPRHCAGTINKSLNASIYRQMMQYHLGAPSSIIKPHIGKSCWGINGQRLMCFPPTGNSYPQQ